jgi:hypothetical protein
VLFVLPGVASAASWSLLQSSLNTMASRPSVSCVSSSVCVSVNAIQSELTSFPSASFWNGTQWSADDAAYPAGATEAELSGVSCPSTSACVAVGEAQMASGAGVPLAESSAWPGRGEWAVQATPAPEEATHASLESVSCTSAEACTAVGYYYTALTDQKTLAERWNGSEWVIQATPNPEEANETGLLGSDLSSVSCVSAESCTAVGSYYDKSMIQLTLIEHWNGKAWTIQASPNPKEAEGSFLEGVSCVSAACFAVGQTVSATNPALPLGERWNGKEWALQRIPHPKEATGNLLQGISCTAIESCVAVGEYFTSTGGGLTLAEHWGGKEWALQATPNPKAAATSSLDGVSCTSSEACIATGGTATLAGETQNLSEEMSTGTWSLLRSSSNTKVSRPSVSCAASNACVNVNAIQSEQHQYPSASFWNGSTWRPIDAVFPAGALEAYFNGVACPATNTCIAVGHSATAPGTGVTLAEHSSRPERGQWTIQSTPNPTEATESSLASISCASAESCTAVGYYYTALNDQKTLAEHWNGSEWAIQATPNPEEANETGLLGSSLSSVSCVSAESCTAVGSYYNKSLIQLTLIEHWSGKAWAIQASPNPKEALGSSLTGVSCPAAAACLAAGGYVSNTNTARTLGERWNGKVWVLQATPNPKEATGSRLQGISCTAIEACTAVGEYFNSASNGLTLAEHWNGSAWALQATPNPKETINNNLVGISCTTSEACIATGQSSPLLGEPQNLSELFS